jgi:hypothetical protein
VSERERARVRGARGCLVIAALYVGAAAILAAVWLAQSHRTDSSSPGPVRSTSSSTYARTPVTFPPDLDLVLSRAWNAGRYGCGLTGPAVDGLAAALERDIAEAPPLDARMVASAWVSEHCRE